VPTDGNTDNVDTELGDDPAAAVDTSNVCAAPVGHELLVDALVELLDRRLDFFPSVRSGEWNQWNPTGVVFVDATDS
jgi:hypothetical protein